MADSSFRTGLLRPVLVVLFGLVLSIAGCGDSSSETDDGSGPPGGPFDLEGPVGKADNAGVPGIGVEYDNTDTQVWSVRNQWEDKTTAEAKQAGLAWPADSGLNWDQKYAAWVNFMKKIAGASYGETFEFVTPFGKPLPAPVLECAEVAIFLRVTFAAWYGLPFFMTATDHQGVRVYFGHFGARTATSKYSNMPSFKTAYKDYSNMPAAEYQANWPSDTKLKGKKLAGADDGNMDFLFPGAKAGAYFDAIYLNKRVGHFVVLLLDYFGSANVANSRNTYNLKPQALRTGDVLVERWQANGIGHTLVVKSVSTLADGRFDAQLVSGSMPRRQPNWDNAVASKNSFTNPYTGGEGYETLGGGLKRWRVAKNWSGKWTNSWMKNDEASWINDTDYERIKARPVEFESLLGEVPPEELRTALLGIIEDARHHLSQYPASCSARERREDAFEQLYTLQQEKFDTTKAQTDSQYRKIDDYVFAELEYEKSKTCCWNSTTADMYSIIMAYEQSLQQTQCVAPAVFMATGGGKYDAFAQYASQTGKSAQWKPWTEDEPCAQKDVASDTEKPHDWTAFCSLTPP